MSKRVARKYQTRKPNLGYLKGYQKHEMSQDKKLASIDKKIRKIQGEAEVKYHDINATIAPITTAGDLVLLNGMGQSASQTSGRIGAKVKSTSLQLHYTLVAPPSTSVDTDTIRLIVFWDNDAKGAAPAISGDPLTPPPALLSSQNGSGNEWLYPYQMETRDRFKVLWDKKFDFNPNLPIATTPATGVVTDVLPIRKSGFKYIKLGKTVQYGDTTSDITGINNNSLYLLAISTSNNATILCNSRFCYKDF